MGLGRARSSAPRHALRWGSGTCHPTADRGGLKSTLRRRVRYSVVSSPSEEHHVLENNDALGIDSGRRPPHVWPPLGHAPSNGRRRTLEATFYVATDGSDSWSGRLPAPNADRSDGPFATLEKARDAIRRMERTGRKTPLVTMVRGGKYFWTRHSCSTR